MESEDSRPSISQPTQQQGSRQSQRLRGADASSNGLTDEQMKRQRRKIARSTVQLSQHDEPEVLQRRLQENLETHSRAPKTLKDYASSLGRVREWLESAPAECTYKDGLDRCDHVSEEACNAWLVQHMDSLSLGSLKAYHSALAWHFQVVHGCSDDVKVGFSRGLDGKWIGNPVYGARYHLTKKSLLRKLRKKPAQKQALPMLYPLLARVLTSLDSEASVMGASRPHELTVARTEKEYLHAWMILAYRLWLRCDEACSLTWGDIDHIPKTSPEGSQYVTVTLIFRKTNQMDPKKSNVYELHYLPGRPKTDAITAIARWRAYWEWVVHRPPQPEDLVFPSWRTATGELTIAQKKTASEINGLLSRIEDLAAEAGETGQRFTSHSFRRGGAQDAVIWAPRYGETLKSLAYVRWWGGWSQDEDTHVLERYILNEITTREAYFGDAENPLSEINRRNLWAGGNSDALQDQFRGLRSDLAEVQASIASMQTRFLSALHHQVASPLAQVQAWQTQHPHQIACSSTPSSSSAAQPSMGRADSLPLSSITIHSPAAGSTMPPVITNITNHGTLVIIQGHQAAQRILPVTTVEGVVQQWERGNPASGLTPLKDWVPAMRRKGRGGNASLYANRKKIYDAYTKRGHSYAAFYQAYGNNKSLKEYLAAIQEEARLEKNAS